MVVREGGGGGGVRDEEGEGEDGKGGGRTYQSIDCGGSSFEGPVLTVSTQPSKMPNALASLFIFIYIFFIYVCPRILIWPKNKTKRSLPFPPPISSELIAVLFESRRVMEISYLV